MDRRDELTAIVCDHLVEQEKIHEILLQFLDLFPNAHLFCSGHNANNLTGPLAHFKVTSSSAFSHSRSGRELKSKKLKVFLATKEISIPCCYKTVIYLSQGIAQCIDACKESRKLLYLYDLSFLEGDWNFVDRVFSGYIKKEIIKKLSNFDKIFVPSKKFEMDLKALIPSYADKIKKIEFGFVGQDFKLIKSSIFHYDHVIIDAYNRSNLDLLNLPFLNSKKIVVLDADEKLRSTFVDKNNIKFFDNLCDGELAPIFSGAAALYVDNKVARLEVLYKALATGCPIVSSGFEYVKTEIEDLELGVHVFVNEDKSDIFNVVQALPIDHRAKISALGQKFSESKFKRSILEHYGEGK